MRESIPRQLTAELLSRSTCAKLREQTVVTRGVNDYRDIGVVFCGRSHHRRPTNINLLDDVFALGAGGHRLHEGVQIHDHETKRLNTKIFEGGAVVGVTQVGQNPAVDRRVQCFYSTVQSFGKTGHLADIGDRNSCFAKLCGG